MGPCRRTGYLEREKKQRQKKRKDGKGRGEEWLLFRHHDASKPFKLAINGRSANVKRIRDDFLASTLQPDVANEHVRERGLRGCSQRLLRGSDRKVFGDELAHEGKGDGIKLSEESHRNALKECAIKAIRRHELLRKGKSTRERAKRETRASSSSIRQKRKRSFSRLEIEGSEGTDRWRRSDG